MKQLALTALILFGTMLSTQMPLSAQVRETLPHWRFGHAAVYTIQDMVSDQTAGTFPDAKEVFEQCVPNGKAQSSISTFLIRIPVLGEKPINILVDTGFGNRAGGNSQLPANLKKVGYGVAPDDISLVLLTHLHGDHIGGLLDGENRRFSNAKVLCSKEEYDYWIGQNNALVKQVKNAYGDDFRGAFGFDETLSLGIDSEIGGIKAVDARGHTPGHTAFLLESSGEKLMIVGDLVHAAAVQFPHPDVCARYDMDAKQAVEARKRLLDMAAEQNIPIAGMHLPGTGFALIKKDANGGYRDEGFPKEEP